MNNCRTSNPLKVIKTAFDELGIGSSKNSEERTSKMLEKLGTNHPISVSEYNQILDSLTKLLDKELWMNSGSEIYTYSKIRQTPLLSLKVLVFIMNFWKIAPRFPI